MAGKTIYPSIPSPGNDAPSMRATLDAIRQAMTMMIINAQSPSPNFTPSSAAQVFVTNERLQQLGVKGAVPSGASVAKLESEVASLRQRVARLEARITELSS
jgi:hypothetical protein